jgi:putative ABC transport system permease protein
MLKNYLKMSLKVLGRRKFFTFISLFGISFTLVVLMVAASMLDHVFGQHEPETRLDRTVGVYWLAMTGEKGRMTTPPGYGFINRYLRNVEGVERMTVIQHFQTAASFLDGKKIKSYLKRTDGEFWSVYDFQFIEGSPWTADDEKNANFVAVINEATRERFFNGDPALGKTIDVDGQRFRVVGVVGNVPISRLIPFADIWVPLSTSKSDAYKTASTGNFVAIFVAKSKGHIPGIREEIDSRIRNSDPPEKRDFPQISGGADTLMETVSRVIFGQFHERKTERLIMFFGLLTMLFMLLPTVNLVNINLSRILERSSEIGVRKAFGASSRTLVGQFVMENLILTLIGGAVGLILSALVLRALNGAQFIAYSDFQLNLRIFFSALVLALVFGIISGVYPAWRMSRLNPVEALRGRSK